MNQEKYIGMDVHAATISVAVKNAEGKLLMECVLETKAVTILEFMQGLRGTLAVTFEEGTMAAWLHDRMSRRKLMYSVEPTHQRKSQISVAWIAFVEETKRMKSINKAILGMVSESLGRNESERTGDPEKPGPRGRARGRRAKAVWTDAN